VLFHPKKFLKCQDVVEEHLPLKVPGGKLPREWTGMSYLVDVVDGHYVLKKK
jgi:hypothetical protein